MLKKTANRMHKTLGVQKRTRFMLALILIPHKECTQFPTRPTGNATLKCEDLEVRKQVAPQPACECGPSFRDHDSLEAHDPSIQRSGYKPWQCSINPHLL